VAQRIEKNDHVTYSVQESNGNYEITYRFMDHFMNFQTYRLSLPIEGTDAMIQKFGIPNWLFEPYVDNASNRAVREREIQRGLFTLNGQTIEVDKSAVLEYYSAVFAQPIAKMIVSSLADYGADTRTNRIEFAIRFVQDIPYGVPEYQDQERHYGGVHIPPELLIRGFGDCDSKVLLFVGILTYLVPADEIIFLNQKEHVLSAIKGIPEEGKTYVSFQEMEFLIAETAGPGKRLWGEKGTYYRERFNIETLKIKAPEVLPFEESDGTFVPPTPVDWVDENTLMIRNDAMKNFRFQISTDNRSWETIVLNSRELGKYIFNQKALVYLRFQENNRKQVTYRVSTGSAYTIFWNKWKNKWEILMRQS
jgi:hypothetical protein